MTTYTYLKQGPMHKRPFHLLSSDGKTAVCGAVQRGGAGVTAVCWAPTPVSEGLVCLRCREAQAEAVDGTVSGQG